jgi:hypothetical protein
MIFAGETEVLGENLPSATLSTTNPTWIDPGTNPGLHGERPATNCLSHGRAKCWDNTLKLGHDRFLLNLFKFIIQLPPFHLMLYNLVRVQVLMAVSVKMTAFWDLAPCSLVDKD